MDTFGWFRPVDTTHAHMLHGMLGLRDMEKP